jgi:hypothetical protein
MSAGPFRGRPVDANEGDETSDQFVHLPQLPQPSSDYRFVHLPYDRLRKQRRRSMKVTMRCICASEGSRWGPLTNSPGVKPNSTRKPGEIFAQSSAAKRSAIRVHSQPGSARLKGY